MKKLPKKFHKTDGYELKHISMLCIPGEDINYTISSMKVVSRSGITHTSECDFVAGNNSHSFKNVFELTKPTLVNVPIDWNITGFTICHPDNVNEAIDYFEKIILEHCIRKVLSAELHISKLKQIIKKLQ